MRSSILYIISHSGTHWWERGGSKAKKHGDFEEEKKRGENGASKAKKHGHEHSSSFFFLCVFGWRMWEIVGVWLLWLCLTMFVLILLFFQVWEINRESVRNRWRTEIELNDLGQTTIVIVSSRVIVFVLVECKKFFSFVISLFGLCSYKLGIDRLYFPFLLVPFCHFFFSLLLKKPNFWFIFPFPSFCYGLCCCIFSF